MVKSKFSNILDMTDPLANIQSLRDRIENNMVTGPYICSKLPNCLIS